METGNTLRENNLEVIENIKPISARFIANKSSYKFKTETICSMVAGLGKISEPIWDERVLTGLEPYTPGEQPQKQKLIKLNTNENPYPPSPRVAEALAGEDGYRLYPDPTVREGWKRWPSFTD